MPIETVSFTVQPWDGFWMYTVYRQDSNEMRKVTTFTRWGAHYGAKRFIRRWAKGKFLSKSATVYVKVDRNWGE